MHTAVGYIRVSTEEQAREGVSLAAQRKKIEAWCDLHDHKLISVHEDVFSGASTGKRSGLKAALDEACRRKSALVCYSLSRLARSTVDAILISDRLQRAGADLVSLSEKIDSTSAAGKMIFRLLAVLAEFERDQLAERTRTAMRHLQSQGKRISRHTPYGFDLSPCEKILLENPAEQAVIELMIDLRSSGLSFRAIAQELEARSILTKQCRSKWSPKVVRDLVSRQGSAA